MVTLSVTPYRIGNVLRQAAGLLDDWHPEMNPLMRAIDQAANYVPGNGTPDAMDTTLAAFASLSDYLACPAETWERLPGRTRDEVQHAMREAAKEVTA
jgi:hypothetical protein